MADPQPVIALSQEMIRQVVRETGADMVISGEVRTSLLLAGNGINRGDHPRNRSRSGCCGLDRLKFQRIPAMPAQSLQRSKAEARLG
jgi:hypothetical protein